VTHPLADALEQAFQDVRDRDLSLGEKLQVIADLVRDRGPVFADAVDRFVARLEAARAGESAPQVGDQMPLFTMPDQDGNLVSLAKLLENGPVVVAIHRGHWCPYCRLNMVGLAEIEEAAKPAQIVAMSSELQRYTRMLSEEAGGSFPFLTDVGGGYALSLNLAIWVDEGMSKMIEGAGWDAPVYQGGTGWILPIPAVFVIRQDGTIAARHVDPDYRRRMELDDLLSGVELALQDAGSPVRGTEQVEKRARFA
jgi:peroxiredoxin